VISSSATFGGPTGSGSGFVVTLQTSGANEYLADLVYSFAALGTGSILRIDAQSVWVPARPKTEIIPRDGSATLTGYAALSLARPSSGAASVRLDARDSARLARALDALPVSPRPECMEESIVYRVEFRTDRPDLSYQLIGLECESTVEISQSGRQLLPLHDSACAVMRLIGDLLPAKAIATREVAAGCKAFDG
jgi:hypothetical protein